MIPSADDFERVAVIGGGGYVGSALVPALLKRGYEVTVVDLFLFGEGVLRGNGAAGALKLVRADIRDESALRTALEGQDAVIHLACVSNDPSFELDPHLGKSINYDAFPGVLRAVREGGARRFVNASTSSVYGVREEQEVKEDSPCDPLTDYSKYKLECERLLQDADLGDCDWVTLRPATVCGYAPRLRLDVIVNILTINALARKKITVLGGSQLRPNLNIQDMVRAYLTMLDSPAAKISGQTFNAGYENRSVAELAQLVFDEVGDPAVEIAVEPTNDPRSYHINSDKIREVVGFEPEYTIRDAVRSICEAFRSGSIPDALEDSRYYNIRRMQERRLTSSEFTAASAD